MPQDTGMETKKVRTKTQCYFYAARGLYLVLQFKVKVKKVIKEGI